MRVFVPIAAFVSGLAVAYPFLTLGLAFAPAVPLALVCGSLASGLGAYFAVRSWGHLAPVLAISVASLAPAALIGAALVLVVGTSLLVTAPVVFAVVAAASTFAVWHYRARGERGGAPGGRGLRRWTVLAVLAVVLTLLLVPVGQFGYAWLTACTGEERAVFEEFPQYSPRAPRDLHPRPDDPETVSSLGSACVVSHRTPDLPTEVLAYFEARLEENGWEVRSSNSAALYARRGDYEYRVSFSGDPTGTREDLPVSVVVRKP